MTTKRKKSYKLWIKILITSAYVLIATFFLTMILGTYLIVSNASYTIPTIIVLSQPIVAMVIAFVGSILIMERESYLKQIKKYRLYRHFNIIVDLIADNKFSEAVDLYNALPHGIVRDFLWGHILTARLYSNDENQKNKGLEKLNELREEWSQYNINLK